MIALRILFAVAAIAVGASDASAQSAQSSQRLSLLWSSGLGIYATAITEPLARDLGLPRPKGLLVLAVSQGGPADQASVKPGDLIVALSSQQIWSEQNREARIQLVRAGQERIVSVRSGKVELAGATLLRPTIGSRPPGSLVVDPAGGANLRTITAATLRARPGDTIFLRPGAYGEEVLLPPGVTIRATDKFLARVETEYPWRVAGSGGIQVSGIAFSGGGVVVDGADGFALVDCMIATPAKGTGLLVRQSKNVSVAHCAFTGAPETDGIIAIGSQIEVSDSLFSGQGGQSVSLKSGSRGEVSKNLFEKNASDLEARDCTLTATANLFTGVWGPESKDHVDFGIRVVKSAAVLSKNVVRQHRYGVIVIDAPTPAKISDNTMTQGQWGVYIEASPVVLTGNLVMQNLNDGITVANKKENKANPPEVVLSRNTISGNEEDGVYVSASSRAAIRENLVEANRTGIRIDQSTATIENNTVVLQKGGGVRVQANSTAAVSNNIIAFNSFGLELDVTASSTVKYNDIHGNLASREFPLVDANYVRVDRYKTRDGRKVPVEIYPAYDLKSDTDTNIDPGFETLGSEYTLKSDSQLAQMRGVDQRYIGAYAPSSRSPR